MRTVIYKDKDFYKDIDGTLLFLDVINSRVKILNHQYLKSSHLIYAKQLAIANNMGKIISFAPQECYDLFQEAGFKVEGRIEGFFKGTLALCYSYFIDSHRMFSSNGDDEKSFIQCSQDHFPGQDLLAKFPYLLRDASYKDIPQMIKLFKSVFATYPSPVFNGNYIFDNIQKNKVRYKVALHDGKVIGIASAEMDHDNLNAEITDCVTLPLYRGQGILTAIIQELEEYLQDHGFICLYSLARTKHPAVNKAFYRQGYTFSGRMVNNCDICGSLEDMNIWVKLIV
ncbi:putative beta-lysine N-acetyltransferase [Syntrophomonas erecta]